MISKFAPKREKFLVPKCTIKEPLTKICTTEDYYITPTGKVYREYPNGFYYRKAYKNKKNGYLYITIVEANGMKKTYRLHRLVAIAYLPNPNNYPIVGHKDNVKEHCEVSNLYWTTNAENIKKAVADGLLVNDKGYADSQSKPVICYDKNFIKVLSFGSVSECHRKLGVSKSTITRHCDGKIKTRTRCGFYFRYQNV